MIYLSSSDDFIKKSLTNLISQINPHLTTFEKNLSFAYIEVQKSNDQLYLFYCEKKEIVRTPIKINDARTKVTIM